MAFLNRMARWPQMNISILRVLGVRSTTPVVLARVDEHRVRWNSRKGWTCACLAESDNDLCRHIDAVADLLDPRVLAGDRA